MCGWGAHLSFPIQMHILLNGYVPYTYDLYVCLICISHVHSLCVCHMYVDEERTSSITGESWRRFTIAGSGWNFRRNSSSAMGPVKMTLLDQTLQLHVIPLLSHTLTYCHIYGVSLVMNHLHLAPQLALSGMECAAISSCRCRIRKGNKHHYWYTVLHRIHASQYCLAFG